MITAVFIALKRTALIGIISSLFAYFLVKFKKQDEKKFKLVLYCMIGVLIFIIIYQIIVKYTGNDLIEKMMNKRMMEVPIENTYITKYLKNLEL